MSRTRLPTGGIRGILQDAHVRQAEHHGRTFWSAVDLLDELLLEGDPARAWEELRARRPEIASVSVSLEFSDGTRADALDLEGVLRMVQSVSGERAERVRWWLAEAGRQRLEEAEDPEIALLRTRRLYEAKGHDRKWVDKRLRGMTARQELTAEWYRRGARASDEYRALTNEMMKGAFGMDVETFRVAKGLTQTSEPLRDHMTDMELALTTLAETAAAALHRAHGSTGIDQLSQDVRQAGELTGHARAELEHALSSRPQVDHPGEDGHALLTN